MISEGVACEPTAPSRHAGGVANTKWVVIVVIARRTLDLMSMVSSNVYVCSGSVGGRQTMLANSGRPQASLKGVRI